MPTTEADVVVIGTGAGGSPAALTLARAGAKVVMLERGKRYSRKDFIHDEIAIARRDFFTPSAEDDPHMVVADGDPPKRTNEGWVSVCVGGGTVHMSGFFYRFHPDDFRVADVMGTMDGTDIRNWPISYDDLAPYYAKVVSEIGVSGPANEGPWAAPAVDGGYPMPPVDAHPFSAMIDEAGKKVGCHPFRTPRAIITKDFKGRSQCVYCHLCGGFGCEVGAKSSTLDTLIPEAEATGNCEVVPEAMALRIETDDAGKANGVVYRDSSGTEHKITARVVVVACSAIESARLLLMSTSSRFPYGLANNGGRVGQRLMFSTFSKSFGAFRYDKDPKRAEILKDHAPFMGRSVLDYYVPKDKNAPVKKAGGLNFLFPPGGPIYQSEYEATRTPDGLLWGSRLKENLKRFWLEERQIQCETFGEYLPTPGTRVELDPEVKDQFGLPVARILIDRHPHDFEVSQYLADRGKDMFEAMGADRAWVNNVGGRTMHLPSGVCSMGDDPKDSVVDPTCRTHEVPNVYVTDGSVFVSSGGVPPTFTILANSFRVGDIISETMKRKDL